MSARDSECICRLHRGAWLPCRQTAGSNSKHIGQRARLRVAGKVSI